DIFQQAADGTRSLKGVPRILYNLPEVMKAETVFIVEGEKCVEELRKRGLVASCNSGGAGQWRPEFGKSFEGKTVLVLPDNDEPGRKHSAQVMESLDGAKRKAILVLPGLAEKEDVADWFEHGGTVEKFLELAEKALSDPDDGAADEPFNSEVSVRAGSQLVKLLDNLRTGNVPRLIPTYTALRGIEVGRGLLNVTGAPPATGKTALMMQLVYDTLELDHNLRAVIANAEMDFDVLLRREITRMTRISSDAIRFADLTAEQLELVTEKAAELIPRLDRVRVLQEPHTLEQLLRLGSEPPGLLLVDYLQKFAPRELEPRQGVGQVMSGLRSLAKKGWAVVAISATSRPQKGATKLTMASLRESSEIEFNADSIYLMQDNGPHDGCEYIRDVTLICAKNRHGAPRDIELIFHKPRLEFTSPKLERPEGSANTSGDPFDDEAPF
ncbi:MAG: DnaB-like helicase C-terminal domain-containing protein, partial [Aureliella sp.]